MNSRDMEIKALKLDLIDLTQGVNVSYLWNYNNELKDLVDLSSQERYRKLKELARKIKKECKE